MGDAYADGKEVARTNRAFYQAFEELDLEAMEHVWLEDDAVRCVHPGSAMILGRQRVLSSWKAIFESTERIRFELADLAVEVHGELACVHAVERITSSAGDEELRGEAVATNLFIRRDGAWRMLLHHASPLARRLE